MSGLPVLTPELIASGNWQSPVGVALPTASHLSAPIRAVQFGTGAFLRGFIDALLDEANLKDRFNGRVVAIGSTGSGRDQLLNAQSGLYTLVEQGLVDGHVHRARRVVGSLRGALSAQTEWNDVLALARLPELEFVFSNSSEVGIVFDAADQIASNPPCSFPGKLARFLYERALAFEFDTARGVIVLPCELIERNGEQLQQIVLQLSQQCALGDKFRDWLGSSVQFCNTLVDRIVPGAPVGDEALRLRAELGYDDAMLTTCEPYRLFAIQGSTALRARLPFVESGNGVFVVDDIAPFAERKVRLLNGVHTLSAAVALLCQLETVGDAVRDADVGAFMRRAMFEELVPTLPGIGAEQFAADVLERFANPFIRHALFDITLHSTAKWRVRVVPSILRSVALTGEPPAAIAFAFAAHLLFARGDLQNARRNDGLSVPNDSEGAAIRVRWTQIADDHEAVAALVERVCADAGLWGTDLSLLPGFVELVATALVRMLHHGVPRALRAFMSADVAAT